MDKLIISLGLVVIGISAGYIVQILVKKKYITLSIDAARKKL